MDLYFPIVGITIIYLFYFLPEICTIFGRTIYIPIISDLSYNEKINDILTFAIAMFAGYEGYSAYFLYISEEKKEKN